MVSGLSDKWMSRSREIGFRLLAKPFGYADLIPAAHALFGPGGTSI
jgi:hypothetical protein